MSKILSSKQINLIKKIYQDEYSKLNKLSNDEIIQLEKNLSRQNLNSNQLMLKGIIEDIINFDQLYYPSEKDLSSIAKLDKNYYFEIEECFKKYQIIKNNKGLFGFKIPNFIIQFLLLNKNNNDYYFVKTIQLQSFYINKDYFNTFKESISILDLASKLNITFKLKDKKICKINNIYTLILFYKYDENGIVLSEWIKNNKFTRKHKKQIIELINIGQENNFLVGNLNSNDIIVLENKNNQIDKDNQIKKSKISFKLLNLGFTPDYISNIIDNKIKNIENNISFYEKNNKFHNLIIEKMITNNLI